MATVIYEGDVTALLVIDPYNDFISEGGKLWGRLKAIAKANSCVPHISPVLNAAAITFPPVPPRTIARRATGAEGDE